MKDMPLAIGKKEYLKHISGGKITRTQAMKAKCYECMGYFVDGKMDCKIESCPMFFYRPYKDKGLIA